MIIQKICCVDFSALFALFTLMINHLKHHATYIDSDAPLEGFVAEECDARLAKKLTEARFFVTSWSFDFALCGVVSFKHHQFYFNLNLHSYNYRSCVA